MKEGYWTCKACGPRGRRRGQRAYGDARYEITCEIYHSTVHAVFAESYPEASEKAEGMELELKEYVMSCECGTIDPNAWIEAFVVRR